MTAKKAHAAEPLDEFNDQLEKLCEKYLKKGLRAIDIIGTLEFWKTEYLSDLFYVHPEILSMKKEIESIHKRLQDLEKKSKKA